ncbi:MAG: arsenate reductase (glutaredoxin) [Cyclobacteriaceae bacterium]
MTKVLHNPRCQKSRQTVKLLEERGESFDIVEYLKDTPTKEEMQAIIHMLGISPLDLIRKSEAEYKVHYKGKTLSDDQWVDAMIQHPKLIERPIVIKEGKAAIGRPPEQVLDIL